jgi:hypothetical protein
MKTISDSIIAFEKCIDILTKVIECRLDKQQCINASQDIDHIKGVVAELKSTNKFTQQEKDEMLSWVKDKIPTLKYFANKNCVLHIMENKINELDNSI